MSPELMSMYARREPRREAMPLIDVRVDPTGSEDCYNGARVPEITRKQ